ncbi:MAG: hydrogenase maturation protease [Actinomycetota bacterium]|nr:hydrogenase maturation protease [Acidimicrobiia bacterium]MDQ3293087.1 hydrogenase maturation protease [Actinomycetota bacterium]
MSGPPDESEGGGGELLPPDSLRRLTREARSDGARSGCVLVGGIGLPWLRDLDFGTQFVRRIESLTWPPNVVVEDLSYAAHRVLHLLQELEPVKVILVGAMPRKLDEPGTIRRYRLDLEPPDDIEVHERLTEAIGGIIDLDHTLAVVRYWGAFPEDTIVIEVEPGDDTFGLGFSDPVEASVEAVLAMIRDEVGAAPAVPAAPVDATGRTSGR